MVIQETVLSAYNSIIKRIHSWILPLILILLIGTAYGRTDPVALSYFSSIELISFHFYLGWVMGLIWLVLVYNFFFNLLSKWNKPNDSATYTDKSRLKDSGLTKLVNLFFYFLLFLICFSGIVQYSSGFTDWQPLQFHYVDMRLAHIGIAWLFISSALIKYYLSITRWLANMFRYLRED